MGSLISSVPLKLIKIVRTCIIGACKFRETKIAPIKNVPDATGVSFTCPHDHAQLKAPHRPQ